MTKPYMSQWIITFSWYLTAGGGHRNKARGDGSCGRFEDVKCQLASQVVTICSENIEPEQ